ncbi:LuxR C-terminal-related transcriptional regulator [Streptomyces sp. NPDC051976]|uniref:helix-turn-helix transcriptional regulator n=1 Tax=Streptomyces sp. NPDC051976 TaxID=3154947 RepID=UPI003435658C
MHIEAKLPLFATPGEGTRSLDPQGEMLERADEVMRVVRDVVPGAAYALCAWDPLAASHVHRPLVNEGFSDRFMEHVNDSFIRENPAFPVMHTQVSGPLRWRDLTREWGIDFAKTVTAEEFLIPEGYREGATCCLRLRDGRYTGAVHVSWVKEQYATDERRDTLARFRPVLAAVCDMLRAPNLLASAIAPGASAIVVSAGGVVADLPGYEGWFGLPAARELRTLLARHQGPRTRRRFLWPDIAGVCRRIEVFPCTGGALLMSAETIPWPYGLSARELQVLHVLARGLSNPGIARALSISPRTASTHVEHILAKLNCASRSRLAAVATEEGLLLVEDPTVR